jgi:molybdopterin-guanine dinucleotide biosynthesis protein A
MGAVLAGGVSTRMGSPKALIDLGGVPLVERAMRPLLEAGLDVAIVAKHGDELPPVEAAVWIESRPEHHPLVGILEALRRADCPVVVCACDMPFVTPALVKHIAALEGTAVPEADGRLHPLLARYDPAAAPVLAAALEQGKSVHEAVRDAGATIVPEADIAAFGAPGHLLFNVNTPADLARAQDLL